MIRFLPQPMFHYMDGPSETCPRCQWARQYHNLKSWIAVREALKL